MVQIQDLKSWVSESLFGRSTGFGSCAGCAENQTGAFLCLKAPKAPGSRHNLGLFNLCGSVLVGTETARDERQLFNPFPFRRI
jgi:hypothetical protein